MPLWGMARTAQRDGRLPTAGSGVKNARRKAAAFNSGRRHCPPGRNTDGKAVRMAGGVLT